MSASKRIITVFGATGNQGGAVVNTFLTDAKLKNEWAVRGITRDVSKDSAKALADRGVEVVAADLNDKDSLVKAIKGSYAVFAVTNYWEKLDDKLEITQGKNIADAAKATDIKHFIWSSLKNVTKLTNGKLSHVYHFDSKAAVEEYTRSLGIPATFFLAGFYMSNLPGQNFRENDGNWTLALPVDPEAAKIPMYDPADTGKYVKGIVLNREKLLGKQFLGATAYQTPNEIVADFKKAFPEAGKTAGYYQVPHDQYLQILQSIGFPEFVAEETLENMRLLVEGGYFGFESLDESHSYVEDTLTTWADFVKKAPAFKDLK